MWSRPRGVRLNSADETTSRHPPSWTPRPRHSGSRSRSGIGRGAIAKCWVVITRADEDHDGNLCDEFVTPANPREVNPDSLVDGKLHVRRPVFYVGELLLLDEYGREIGYPGRKPGRWDISYETFPCDRWEDAARRASEVTDAWVKSQ